MTELDQLSRTIGSIETELKTTREHQETMSTALKDLCDEIRSLRQDFGTIRRVVDEIEPEVETLRTLRNRGIGILIGVGLAGGTISIGAWKAIESLFQAPGG